MAIRRLLGTVERLKIMPAVNTLRAIITMAETVFPRPVATDAQVIQFQRDHRWPEDQAVIGGRISSRTDNALRQRRATLAPFRAFQVDISPW